MRSFTAEAGDEDLTDFSYALVDLNSDSMKDALVQLGGSYWCGTGGCTLLILKGDKGSYEVVSKISVMREPVLVSERKVLKWKSLILNDSDTRTVWIDFDGKRYPATPSGALEASPNEIKSARQLKWKHSEL